MTRLLPYRGTEVAPAPWEVALFDATTLDEVAAAVAMKHTAMSASAQQIEFLYDESEPRDAHGRWTKGGESDPVVLTRDPTDDPNLAPSTAVAETADKWAGEMGQHFEGYDYGESVDDYTRSVSDMDHWVPGSAAALTDAVSVWQGTYGDARDITMAADALRGYATDEYMDRGWGTDMAYAKEILNALAGDVPDGARSTNALYPEDAETGGESVGQIELQQFGDGDLVRGVSDDDGALVDAFQNAADSDREISWSVAAFVMPDAGVFDGVGGNQKSNDAVALVHADHAGGNAVLISLQNAEGLNIDGQYEALVGGDFKVVSIEKDSSVWLGQVDSFGKPVILDDETADLYDVEQDSRRVTRVTLTQTATPEPIP